MSYKDVLIIGSGPSGLAVGTMLEKAGTDYLILEKENSFGGAYRKMNPEIKLLSPRSFNSLPLKQAFWKTEVITAGEFLQYLSEYVSEFDIKIQFNTVIKKVTKQFNEYHIFTQNEKYACKSLVLATGMVNFPRQPELKIEGSGGIEIQQAIDFKGTEYYKNKRTLILGSGTSAIELATLLAGTTEVFLALNQELKTYPLNFLGKNIHYYSQYLEKVPVKYSQSYCEGKWTHPGFDFGIKQAIAYKKVKLCSSDFIIRNNTLTFPDGEKLEVEILINCTGYSFDTGILPEDVKKRKNGLVETVENESVSHKKLYIMGHPCSGGLDSPFLRGIKKDAVRVAEKIRKDG